jgi:hypothetical protein
MEEQAIQLAKNIVHDFVPYKSVADVLERFADVPDFNPVVFGIHKHPKKDTYHVSEIQNIKAYPDMPSETLVERATIVTAFLNTILPSVTYDISGYYPFDLLDQTISHEIYDQYFGFSRHKYTQTNIILFPDIYQLTKYNYNNTYHHVPLYDIPFEKKKNKVIFAGSSVGEWNPLNNQRCQVANYAFLNQDVMDYHITEVHDPIFEKYFKEQTHISPFLSPHVSLKQQLEYKCILSIDGNTACWDRPIWVMRSNSILIKKDSPNQCWYYPLWKAGTHFVESSLHTMRDDILALHNNPNLQNLIRTNANVFTQQLVDAELHVTYAKELFNAIAENKSTV